MLRRFRSSSEEPGTQAPTPPGRSAATRSPALDASALDSSALDASAVMRRIMPDLYFINTPSSQMERHLDLLRTLHCNADSSDALSLDFHGARNTLTELTFCAFDDVQPGLLSKVCSALTAHRVSIHTAFVFTSSSSALESALGACAAEHLPDPTLSKANSDDAGSQRASTATPARGIVLGTLFLAEPYGKRERALSSSTKTRVRADITRVLKGETDPASLLSRTPHPFLQNVEVAARPDATGRSTLITLRAPDVPGLLYRLTSALASLDLNIRVAQINTESRISSDVFFVDRDGRALSEAECRALPAELGRRLNERAL